jgi:hypothetical protein
MCKRERVLDVGVKEKRQTSGGWKRETGGPWLGVEVTRSGKITFRWG